MSSPVCLISQIEIMTLTTKFQSTFQTMSKGVGEDWKGNITWNLSKHL